jgi:hypothetical protein
MNEQRAFTVVVNGCKNCPKSNYVFLCCMADLLNDEDDNLASYRIFKQNENAITPTCPMWNEAKPIGELK